MKIAFFSNYPSHYRLPIDSKLSEILDIDFYFGNKVKTNVRIKQFEKSELKNYKKQFKTIFIFRGWYWCKGSLILLSKKYKRFLLVGENNCITTWVVLFYAKLTGKKAFIWTHGFTEEKYSFLYLLFVKFFIKISAAQFVYGNYAIENMKRLGFDTSKMYAIHNSLNTEKQTLIFSKLHNNSIYSDKFNNKFPTIIFSGRVQAVKRIDLLLKSISFLQKNGSFCNLIIIGNIDNSLNINKIIEKLNLTNSVWLYGPEYNEEILGNLFYNAHVCVSPGNVGLSAIHSMSYGTPVISHNNFSTQMPEFESIIPGITGDFFVENNIPDLSKTIKKWINIKNRESVRLNCRNEILKNWSISYQAKMFKKHLLE